MGVNVFADLGLPNAEEHFAKVQLAFQINLLIKKKRLNQVKAAELLGTDQAKISALHKGRLDGFSIERLFRFLNILGQEIVIKITPKKTKKRTSVRVDFKGMPADAHITPKSNPATGTRKK